MNYLRPILGLFNIFSAAQITAYG